MITNNQRLDIFLIERREIGPEPIFAEGSPRARVLAQRDHIGIGIERSFVKRETNKNNEQVGSNHPLGHG